MAISNEELARARKITVRQVELLRRTRGATNETLRFMPEGALLRAIRRLNYPDMPRARHAFMLEQARDDDQRIPTGAIAKAFKEARTMRAAAKARVAGLPAKGKVQPRALQGVPATAAPVAPVAPAAGLATTRWVWLGPGNIGGRTRAIVIDPDDPLKMWAASAGGGIWRTRDGGDAWEPVDDFMANLAACSLVMHPKKKDTIYAGTGEGFNNLDALRGAGIFRTTDGETWAQVPSTATEDFHAVNRLAFSASGKTLLAATGTGILRSTGTHAKWKNTLPGAFADVKFHPRLSSRAVAGSLAHGQAYYSTNGGGKWKVATHPEPWEGRVELTYAVADPDIVYASVDRNGGEIWRSTDGGKSYERRGSRGPDGGPSGYLGDQGWYDNAIWAGDPTDADLVIVGGIDLWKSTDGGETLREISTWWSDNSVHADHHAIVSHPNFDGVNNRTVFFANDGGVHKAQDISVPGHEAQPPYDLGWKELVNNYGVTQFYGGAGHAGSGLIVGGAQDNGTLCYDPARGTEGWRTIFGGDGGWCAADPTDPKVFYGEYVYLNIHRNTDGGTTNDTTGNRYISGQFWNPAAEDWAWKPVPYQIPDAKNFDALFIAPFVLDPNNPSRLLAGGLSLWQTTDARRANTLTSGPSWRSIKGSAGAYISAIAISAANSDIVWVGHANGMVFRCANSTTAQPVWERVDNLGPDPLVARRHCTRIAIHPGNPNIVYVAFGGYVKENVWVTRNGGATWTNLGAGLPAAPVKALAIHPTRHDYVYAGTDVGVFASEDGGASWSPTNEGPASVAVAELFWMGRELVCATHGRGMFKIDLSNV